MDVESSLSEAKLCRSAAFVAASSEVKGAQGVIDGKAESAAGRLAAARTLLAGLGGAETEAAVSFLILLMTADASSRGSSELS